MAVLPRLIVALDVASQRELDHLLAQLDPELCRVKVGKELFTALGPPVIEQMHRNGFEVFLDLKFHDIPNTVAGACRAAAEQGVWMMNVHALGGRKMLVSAHEAMQHFRQPPLLIAVTLLTSLEQNDLIEIGSEQTPEQLVGRLAKLSYDAGLQGVVCSAQEAPMLRRQFGQDFILVTPGIRLPTDAAEDQIRIVTPQLALQQGSDYLVVGRPITQAASPKQKLQEFAQALIN